MCLQWDEDVEVSDIIREYGDIEWLHHNIITQNNIDGIIVGIQFPISCNKISFKKTIFFASRIFIVWFAQFTET